MSCRDTMDARAARWAFAAALCLQPALTGCSRAEETAPAQEPAAAPAAVRPAAFAGSWYPGEEAELRASILAFLDAEGDAGSVRPMALIAPHAGHRYSGATAAWAYRSIRGQTFRRVFVLAPNHRGGYLAGAAVPQVDLFETPLGRVPVDTEATRALDESPLVVTSDRPHEQEHAIEIQLPFLQASLAPGWRLVPVVVGEIDLAAAAGLASALRPLVSAEDLVIVSSDFTHYGENYGYVPFREDVEKQLETLDMGALKALQSGAAEELSRYHDETGITMCGIRPAMVLLSLLPQGVECRLLRYDTSGRMLDDLSNSVSYLAVSFIGPGWPAAQDGVLNRAQQEQALALARRTLENVVQTGQFQEQGDLGLDAVFDQQCAVFVTLKKNGELRGCIGNTRPIGTLAQSIIARTVSAAQHDPRFSPVTEEELPSISIEISVLTLPRAVASHEEIVVGQDGVILTKGPRSAVFLPQVAPEQGWSREEMLDQLSRKAGLAAGAWREGATFEVFQAQVFGEAHE
ncbi:MAG: AmmeMemoRadiSam system protein B [Planctomycetes bacterium]|nr:AmmeMemoRadiSam system protein B [Planctomycetota bacterium]